MTNVGNNGQPGNEKARENFTDSFRKILLIEGDAADARLIRGALADARGGPFDVQWVRKLSDGIESLRAGTVGAIFADLSLPDSCGMDTLDRLLLAAPDVPVLHFFDHRVQSQ